MSGVEEERARRINGFICGYLLEAGRITLEQLDAALERQLALVAQGRTLRLGEVLVEMGAISGEDLERVLVEQSLERADARRGPDGESNTV